MAFQTQTAYDWEHMEIDGQHYLAVANYGNGSSVSIDSVVYRWSSSSQKWEAHQHIATAGAIDWEHMEIEGQHYLVVANSFDGSSYSIDSVVYLWSSSSQKWEEHQRIATDFALDWEHLEIEGQHYLVVANYFCDNSRLTDSVVFRWTSSSQKWEEHQRIATVGAMDWEHMEIDGHHYLAVAHYYDDTSCVIDSVTFRWSSIALKWEEHQRIPTSCAIGWEHMEIDRQHYLAVANGFNGSSFSTNSVVYRWSSSRLRWEEHQRIPTIAAMSWEHMEVDDQHYLAVAQQRPNKTDSIDSVVYRWSSTALKWEELQRIATLGAYACLHMLIKDQHYLAIANSYGEPSASSGESFVYPIGHTVINAGPASQSPQPSNTLRILARLPCDRDAQASSWNCSANIGRSAVAIAPVIVTPHGAIPCANHSAIVNDSMPADMVELWCEWPLEAAGANASIAVLAWAEGEPVLPGPLLTWNQTGGVNVVGPAPLVGHVDAAQTANGWRLIIRGAYLGWSPTVWRGGVRCVPSTSNGTTIDCWCAASPSHPVSEVVVVADGQSSAWRSTGEGSGGDGSSSGSGRRWSIMATMPPSEPWGPITLLGWGMLDGLMPSTVVLTHRNDSSIAAECGNLTAPDGETLRCWPPLSMPAPGLYSARVDGVGVLAGLAVLDASAGVSAVHPWQDLDPLGGELVLIKARHSLVSGLANRGIDTSSGVSVLLDGQPCESAKLESEWTVSCLSPAGSGSGMLVEVMLGGGAVVASNNASWAEESSGMKVSVGRGLAGSVSAPSYSEPVVTSMLPAYVLLPLSGSSNATITVSGTSFVRSGLLGLQVGDFACGTLAVVDDSSALCEALALPSSLVGGGVQSIDLAVRVEWSSAGQLTAPQAGVVIEAVGGPHVSLVQSASWVSGSSIASPASWLWVTGSELGRGALDLRGIWVGGEPCSLTNWHSSTMLGCLLPAVTAFNDSSAPLTNLTLQVETAGGRTHSMVDAVTLLPPSLTAVVSGGEVMPGVAGNVSLVVERLGAAAVGLRAGGEWECADVIATRPPQATSSPIASSIGFNNAPDTLTCVGLSVGASAPAGSSLTLELEWPLGSGRWVSQPGVWLAVWPDPEVSSVEPSSAASSSWVLVGGSDLGRRAEDLRSVSVGGLGCAATEWLSPRYVRCQLPDEATLTTATSIDSEGRLDIAVELQPGGRKSTLQGGLSVLGLVFPQWAQAAVDSSAVMPSSVTSPIHVAGGVLDMSIVGEGALECGVDLVNSTGGWSAALHGTTRVVVTSPQSSSSPAVPMREVGVRGEMGSLVHVRGWCLGSTGQRSETVSTRPIRLASVSALWSSETSDMLTAVAARGWASPLPLGPLNASWLTDGGSGSLVPALLSCSANVSSTAASPSGQAIVLSAQAAFVSPASSGLGRVRFPPLSLSDAPLGSTVRLGAWCEWTPTGERVEFVGADLSLPAAAVRVSPLLGAGLRGEATGFDANLTMLLLPGVGREVHAEVSFSLANGSAMASWPTSPVCGLRLESSTAVASAPQDMLALEALESSSGVTASVIATGSGGAILQGWCDLWGGLRRVDAAGADVLSVRMATVTTSLVESGLSAAVGQPRPTVLSSSVAFFDIQPLPALAVQVAEAPAWALGDASRVQCTADIPAPPPNTTLIGTRTRFVGQADGSVSLAGMGLAGAGIYPSSLQEAVFEVSCDHPVWGGAGSASVDAGVVGMGAAWASEAGAASASPPAHLPSSVGTGEAWPSFSVRVEVAGGQLSASTMDDVAAVTLCTVRVAGSSRVGNGVSQGRVVVSGSSPWIRNEFDALSVTGPRGATLQAEVECRVGDLAMVPVLRHTFMLEGCAPGQQPRTGSLDLCEVCADGSFSDGGAWASCQACPADGAQCVSGLLTLLRGYFRPERERGRPVGNATELHPCFNAEACTLNSTSRAYGCAGGYRGPLCGVCEDGWALFGRACGPCWEGGANAGVVALLCLAAVGMAVFLARRTAQADSSTRSSSSIAIRQLLSHLQGLGALTLFRSRGTELFQAVAGLAQGVSASPMSWGPVACATSMGFTGRFWATVSIPVVAVCLTALAFVAMEAGAWLLCDRSRSDASRAASRAPGLQLQSTSEPQVPVMSTVSCNPLSRSTKALPRHLHAAAIATTTVAVPTPDPAPPSRGWPAIRAFFSTHRYLVSFVIVLFLAYMPLVTLAITALDCYDGTIGGRRYLAADLSVECFVGAHAVVVVGAGVVLAVVGLGFPLLVVAALRGSTGRPSLRFLYDGYRPGLLWWESLVLVRKAGLVMAASLVTDAPSQVAAAMLVLVPALWAQLQFSPYSMSRFNTLETLSLLAMVLTATVSLVYLRASPGRGEAVAGATDVGEARSLSAMDIVVTVTLLGSNAVVVALQAMAVAQLGVLDMLERACERRRSLLPGMKTSRPTVAPKAKAAKSSSLSRTPLSAPPGVHLVGSPLRRGDGLVAGGKGLKGKRVASSRSGFAPKRTD